MNNDKKQWKLSVLRRDGYKCQFPGCTANNVEVVPVHIEGNENVPDNGITICKGCVIKIQGSEADCVPIFKEIVAEQNKKVGAKIKDNFQYSRRKAVELDVKMRYL